VGPHQQGHSHRLRKVLSIRVPQHERAPFPLKDPLCMDPLHIPPLRDPLHMATLYRDPQHMVPLYRDPLYRDPLHMVPHYRDPVPH
jgi:hypothetical protein